jgi:hypothetical protein
MNHIYKAMEKERDKTIWEMWLMLYPHMEKPIWFGEFKAKMLEPPKKIEKQTDDDIFANIKLINAAFGGKVVEI